jgi:hypothetical protein
VTPILFVLAALVIVGNTVIARPRESLIGLGITAVGIPAYLWWRRPRSVSSRPVS